MTNSIRRQIYVFCNRRMLFCEQLSVVRHKFEVTHFSDLDCCHPLSMKEWIPMDNLHSITEQSSFSIEALQPSN